MNFHNLGHKSGDPKAQKNQESKLLLNTDLFYNSFLFCTLFHILFWYYFIFTEVLQREDRKFLYMYLPGSPKINILCDNLIKTKKYIDRIFLNSPAFSLPFHVPRSKPRHHVAFSYDSAVSSNLWQISSLSLVFRNLRALNSFGQVFFRRPLTLNLADISS